MTDQPEPKKSPEDRTSDHKLDKPPDAARLRNATAQDMHVALAGNPNDWHSEQGLFAITDGGETIARQKDRGQAISVRQKLDRQPGSADASPSYIEGLAAIGNDEETQGRYSIEYIERKAKQTKAADPTPTNTPDGWQTVAQKIAQLPMDKQFQVIGSGLMAGIEQYGHDERERAWGRLIGTVEGTGEVLQGLATLADFGAACILGDNDRAGKMGEEFGAALGQTIVGGVRLFQAANQYLYNIGYTDDYAKPFRDIAAAGQKLDAQWSQLPPREQERIKTKLITEMIESGAIGAGGASAVQKASKFTEVLDALAVEAKQLHTAAKPTIKKAVNAINKAMDELVQPAGDTGMGVKMPIPKDPLKDETKLLMSKADDLDNLGPRHPEKRMKGDAVPEKYTPPKWFAAELEHVLETMPLS